MQKQRLTTPLVRESLLAPTPRRNPFLRPARFPHARCRCENPLVQESVFVRARAGPSSDSLSLRLRQRRYSIQPRVAARGTPGFTDAFPFQPQRGCGSSARLRNPFRVIPRNAKMTQGSGFAATLGCKCDAPLGHR